MKQLQNKFVNYMFYGGITKQEYEKIGEEVLEKNRGALSMTSLGLVLMFAGLFLGTFLSDEMMNNRGAYAATEACFLVILYLCQCMKKRGKRFIIPLWYVALTLIFLYAIVLNNVIRQDISATTFCLIMIVAPLLILDRPLRVFTYFAFIICVFVPVEFHQKTYSMAYADTVNALCCLFLGSIIHTNIIHTKLLEMTQRRHIEKERDTDKLTGCLTKAAFERKITQKLQTSENCGVLLVMDLDHFKNINDSYGHVFGDLVLHTVGGHIQECFPETELYGRFGGDEFQIWLTGESNRREIGVRLEKLLSCIRAIETPDDRVHIAASIGVAISPENGKLYSELFENADAALYAAKNLGRGRYVFCPKVGVDSKG